MQRLHVVAAVALGATLSFSLGCAGVKTQTSLTGSGGRTGAGGSGAAAGQPGAGSGTGGTSVTTGSGGSNNPDAACTSSVTCTPVGGEYCGMIGNGCPNGSIDCGTCPGTQVCGSAGICLGGPSCVPLTCNANATVKYCGTIGDGCGSSVDCGTCPSGQTCNGGVCVVNGCVPATCNAGGTQYCGTIGDGCGGTLSCGACSGSFTCGGGGIAGVCGATAANCTPLSCTPSGGEYCGVIGNGCGGTEDCGACMNGMACSTGALANVCPSTQTTCTNLQCNLDKCSGTAETTISGTVYDPAGLNPLYGILLYVPNTAVDPIPQGVSCNTCNSPISGQPVAAGLSDATGHFIIHNAPHGTNVPLVIQTGKWRRQVTLNKVTACQDNPFNDPTTFRLPKMKSEGDMPLIALSTGHADALDCFLRRVGIDDSEFTNSSGNGRVQMYVGGAGNSGDEGSATLASGATLTDAYSTLFANFTQMSKYDVVILTCESEQLASNKAPYELNMKRYADSGGRVFAEHLHSVWIRQGLPPWPATGDWIGVGPDLASPITETIDTTFPKGAALADWLDRKSTRLNSSHRRLSRMPSSA